jgi:hypothetical protein
MFGLFLIIWLPILLGVIVFIPSFIKWQRGRAEKDQLSMQTGRTLSLISFTIIAVLLIIWWAVSNPT